MIAGPQGDPAQAFWPWLRGFLLQEIRPYPGRCSLVYRYCIAATAVMLIVLTFRTPWAGVGVFYTFILPRDSLRSTLKSAATILLGFGAALAYMLSTSILFVGYPLTHVLWVCGSFFLGFFAISAAANSAGAFFFAIVLALAIPTWDSNLAPDAIVTSDLWIFGSVAIALVVTVAVESAFHSFAAHSELEEGILRRIDAVRALVNELRRGVPAQRSNEAVLQLAMQGVSRLRRLAALESSDRLISLRLGTVVSLTGRLVDLSSALVQSAPADLTSERHRLQAFAAELCDIESLFKEQDDLAALPQIQPASSSWPALLELEKTAALLRLSLSASGADASRTPPNVAPGKEGRNVRLWALDAWTNPKHLSFALRGCFAASICYCIMNALDYRGLSMSLTTCVVTALTTIGASRQKQLLRFSGVLIGGVAMGMGSQILVLPMLESIAGFFVLFVAGISIAAWFFTATPRLSYFGLQFALAFSLVQVNTPFPDTDLTAARDSVLGILLGLVVMGLVFDSLGSRPAAAMMKELFIRNLGSLADLMGAWSAQEDLDLGRVQDLRDNINNTFNAVNAQADAVLFEVGRLRAEDLQLRALIRSWQPRLRTLLLLEVAVLQYRSAPAQRESATLLRPIQCRFDRAVQTVLREMSSDLRDGEVVAREPRSELRAALADLRRATERASEGQLDRQAQTVFDLYSRLTESLIDLAEDVRCYRAQCHGSSPSTLAAAV